MINNNTIGKYGELLAEIYLLDNKYKILSRNYRTKFGEIDIVAKKNSILIFFEVKSRYSANYGKPMQSIGLKKKCSIIKNSKLFILENKLFNINIRYDVMEIFLNYKNDKYRINHIKNAFTEDKVYIFK